MKKLPILLSLFLLASCGNEDAGSSKNETTTDSTTTTVAPAVDEPVAVIDTTKAPVNAGSDGAVPLRFNLQKGKRYDYNMRFDLTQEGPNRQMTTTMDVNYDLKVLSEDAKGKTVQVTYDRVGMIMNMGGQKMELNSEMTNTEGGGPFTMVANMFKAMKGKSFTMKVDPKGGISDVKGFEAIGEAIVKEIQVPEGAKPGLLQNFRNQFNEKTARESFAGSFEIFPDKPVKVGDSWKRSSNTTIGAAQKMVTTYTVKEIKGNRVTLDARSDVTLKDSTSGSQNARLIVDATTGLVTLGTFDQKMAGRMKVSSKGEIRGREL